MQRSLARSLLLTSSLTAAAFAGFALPAQARDTLLAGGSTLAEPAYVQIFGGAGGAYNLEYCGVGSGKGQTGFLTNDPTQYLETALSGSDSTICLSLTAANKPVIFGASDATLTSAQISGYSRTGTDGPLIQVPTFGTPITFPVVNSLVTSNSSIALQKGDLCGIFAGTETNWSQTSVGYKFSGAITVVYRTDGSGTTFLTTSRLAATCGSTSPFAAGPTTSFASLFPSGVPANFVGVKGSSNVQQVLLYGYTGTNAAPTVCTATSTSCTTPTIGYLSPDYTSIAPSSPRTSSLRVAELYNGSTAYKPTVANTTSALSTAIFSIPTTASAAANPANWVPLVPTPFKGYPVVGYTTFDLATCYAKPIPAPQAATDAGSDVANILNSLYNGASTATKIETNGFTPVPAAFASALTAVFIKNTSYTVGSTTAGPFNLNINSSFAAAAACAGLGRKEQQLIHYR